MTEQRAIAVLCVHTGRGPVETLREASGTVRAEAVERPGRTSAVLDDGQYDCLLLGDPPGEDRLTVLDRFVDAHPGVPVVLYGASGNLEAALDSGARDVVRPGDGPDQSAVLTTRVRNVVEQVRSRRRAHERDGRLNSLLEHSSDRLSVLDERGRYQFVSPTVERELGHDPADLLGSSAFEYVHPADREEVQELFEQIREEPGRTHTAEYRLRDAEGDWRWIESRGTNRLDDPGVEGIVVNSREVTERRERERKLREERALTDAIFDALPDVFYAFDEEINFLRWNDRLSTVTGYEDEEIATMHPAEFVLPADRQAIFDAIARIVEHDETVTVEARFQSKGGEVIPYEFTGAKMTRDGETLGIVGIGRDISDRKKRQRRFEAVFDNTYQFTGLMEPDGTLLEVNETALTFGGLDREDVIGKRLPEAYWFQHDERARVTAREAVETARQGELFRTELEVQGQDGPEIIDFSVRPLTDEHGDVRLLIPEGRTITALKHRERHLRVLHRFLRHNLRNKMTVIQGNTDLLARELDGDTVEPVRRIQSAVDELVELSDTAHELSRVVTETDAESRPVEVGGLLERVCAELREEHPDASLTLSADASRRVEADWRLRVAFEQLVENAIEHTVDGRPTVEVSVTCDDETVSVAVADDGPGIPEDELVGIVGDGEQTQLTHGTGFGLWLVRMVVDDYGGELSYESSADGGSVVTVTLPTDADRQPVQQADSSGSV
jgi:PAS domain S-box-containing protein